LGKKTVKIAKLLAQGHRARNCVKALAHPPTLLTLRPALAATVAKGQQTLIFPNDLLFYAPWR
jgi:hypothetical protein